MFLMKTGTAPINKNKIYKVIIKKHTNQTIRIVNQSNLRHSLFQNTLTFLIKFCYITLIKIIIYFLKLFFIGVQL